MVPIEMVLLPTSSFPRKGLNRVCGFSGWQREGKERAQASKLRMSTSQGPPRSECPVPPSRSCAPCECHSYCQWGIKDWQDQGLEQCGRQSLTIARILPPRWGEAGLFQATCHASYKGYTLFLGCRWTAALCEGIFHPHRLIGQVQ